MNVPRLTYINPLLNLSCYVPLFPPDLSSRAEESASHVREKQEGPTTSAGGWKVRGLSLQAFSPLFFAHSSFARALSPELAPSPSNATM